MCKVANGNPHCWLPPLDKEEDREVAIKVLQRYVQEIEAIETSSSK